MKVRIKTLEELIKDCPDVAIRLELLNIAGVEMKILPNEYSSWCYTEIKPEEVTAYGHIYDSGEIVWYDRADCEDQCITGGTLRRAEKYDIVFKGEDNETV